jgi:membrane-associated phospholipid phosphatase
VRVSEWIILGYLGYLLALLPVRPIPRARRLGVAILAPMLAVVVVLASHVPVTTVTSLLREWLPLPYVLICYWMTGYYFVRPQERFEARFVAFDLRARRWFGAEHAATRAPRAVLELLEVAYFSCYIVLPAGMIALMLVGEANGADRYWSIVLAAELGCYGVLPWIRTRPPWALKEASALDRRRVLVRRINLLLVREASTQANTFPSGHAAGALAAALAVASVWPAAGAVFFVVAVSIMAGSVVGEYHYAGDAFTGAVTAIAAWGIVSLMGV